MEFLLYLEHFIGLGNFTSQLGLQSVPDAFLQLLVPECPSSHYLQNVFVILTVFFHVYDRFLTDKWNYTYEFQLEARNKIDDRRLLIYKDKDEHPFNETGVILRKEVCNYLQVLSILYIQS